MAKRIKRVPPKHVKGKKKKRFSIEDMQAKEEAYGHKLTVNSVIQMILSYSVAVFAFSYLLYSNMLVALILFGIACLLVLIFILPKEIEVKYYRRGLAQRNKCLNILTQVLSSHDSTLGYAMDFTSKRVTGEFSEDLKRLTSIIMTSYDRKRLHEGFKQLTDKYKDDVIFCQYFEQIETVAYEGEYNIDVFQSLKSYHNDTFSIQNDYIKARKNNRTTVFSTTAIVFVLCLVLALSNGYEQYVKVFSHSMIGMGTSSLFLLLYAFVLVRFFKYYYDEPIMTM